MTAHREPEPDAEAVRRLLAYIGTAMVATGQPVSDIEDELTEVSAALGYPDVQLAAGPTGISLSLASGAPSTFEAVRGPLRLDQAADLRAIRSRLVHGMVTVPAATEQLLALRAKPPQYPAWVFDLGWVVTATGIALILQPGWANVGFAAVGGLIVVGLVRLGQRVSLVATLLPTLAAFILACLVFAAADAGLLEGPLRTLLPPLAVLLPGALIVTAMSELASGDMMAGSARLIYGGVQLLLFSLGILGATRLLDVPPEALGNIRVDQLGAWAAPLGLVLVVAGIAMLESPPLRLLPWIGGVLAGTFAAQTLGQQLGSAGLGSFVGALAASLGAYLVEAVNPRLPRLVVFLPSFWLLVPGTLGLLSTTRLAGGPADGAVGALAVVTAIFAIPLGLLVGTAVARSVRGAVRRRVAVSRGRRRPGRRRGGSTPR